MPGINGSEVAQSLKHFPFEIILLTGEANHDIAIDLFNQGLISNFIRKDRSDMFNQLDRIIDTMQMNYFKKLTATITDSIIKKPYQYEHVFPSCLNDATFINYFIKTITLNDIIEYYLIDTSGSFLMLDFEGKPSWLIVKDIGDMQALDDLCQFEENKVTDEIAKKIEQRDVIMHVFDGNSYTESADMWDKVLYPATIISGETNYYCSYITKPLMNSQLDVEKIASYQSYLSTV